MGTPIDRDTFLARATARFGSHYDYSEIVYKSYKTPIKIRCTIHPVKMVSITPERHLQTTGGCKFCLKTSRSQIVPLGDSLARISRDHVDPRIETSVELTTRTGTTDDRRQTTEPDMCAGRHMEGDRSDGHRREIVFR